MSAIKVELESLSELRYQLLKLLEAVGEAVQESKDAIDEESGRLEEIRVRRVREVEACQEAYENCRSMVDEDGNPPPCSSEAVALQEARQALDQVVTQIDHFQAQAEQLLYRVNGYQDSLVSYIATARDYLERHIQEVLMYLRGQDASLPLTQGQTAHGSEYQRARRRFFREGAVGDYENVPSYVRGWMRQEVTRGGYYHSPPGVDIGHWIRNLNIPENLRPEDPFMNRGRAGLAHRHHVQNF